METKNLKIGLWILGFLVVLNFFAWFAVFSLVKADAAEVVFLNVGQGDAEFIQTPQKHQILIDGGPDSSVLAELSKQMPFYDRTLDLIILTHPE